MCTGFEFTFVRKPEITFDLDLRGLLFSEVPGLNREIQRRLVTIMSNEAVEPARIWINMKTPFYNLVTRKQAGRRGQLKVCTATSSVSKCYDRSAVEGAAQLVVTHLSACIGRIHTACLWIHS